MKKRILALSAISVFLFACSASKDQTTSDKGSEDKTLSHIFVDSAPENPDSITAIRKTAKPNEEVIFNGQVLGRDPVFMDSRSIMVVGDPQKLTPCNAIPGDECPLPWDVCCEDPEAIKASTLTVQVIDATGKPLAGTLKGQGGLTELSHVTISGKLAANSTPENTIVNATRIFVGK